MTQLVNLLTTIKRYDTVDLLQPYVYTYAVPNKRPQSTVSGSSSTKEPCEMDSDVHMSDDEYLLSKCVYHDDDDCDTDEELNRKMGALGPSETSDYSQFHPQYQFHRRERDDSIDSTSTNGSVQVDIHHRSRKKTASSDSTASNGSSYVEVGIQTDAGSSAATSPLEGDIAPNFAPLVASDKLALLIGNENYQKIRQPLLFPKRDVLAFRVALEGLGFKVLSLVDLTLIQMRTIMLAFCKLLGPNVFSLFYFAGHGYEENGENYLMPIDASPARAASEFVSAQEILREMQITQTALNLLIIDCCRVKGVNTQGETTPYGIRGVYGNTIMAYSCQKQMAAFESPTQSNGVYMTELLKKIDRDERIEYILMEVNTAVYGNLYVNQRPVFESDAIGDCRLTAKIDGRAHFEHWKNRSQIWVDSSKQPESTLFHKDEDCMDIMFEYEALYSNMIQIDVSLRQWSNYKLFVIDYNLDNSSLLLSENFHLQGNNIIPNNKEWIKICKFRIHNLQNIEGELHIVFGVKLKNEMEEVRSPYVKHNLGFPLISLHLQEFRSWILSEPWSSYTPNTWV